jgi:hypothetical protein
VVILYTEVHQAKVRALVGTAGRTQFFSSKDRMVVFQTEITVGHMKNRLCNTRKQTKFTPPIRGRPAALEEKQEREPVEPFRPTLENRHSLTKMGLLDNIEKHHGKILTYGWVYSFLVLHNEQITTAIIHSQEDLHLQVPRQFLDHSVEFILDVNSRFVFNIDETRCFNWEELTN